MKLWETYVTGESDCLYKDGRRLKLDRLDNYNTKNILKVMKYIYDKIIPPGSLLKILACEKRISFYLSGPDQKNDLIGVTINSMILTPFYADDVFKDKDLKNLDEIHI